MSTTSWNYHGIIQYEVDTEADLSSIPNPKRGEVALALAERSLWLHSGSVWEEISSGGSGLAFTISATIVSPTVDKYIIWRAPFACTVTNVRGYVDVGTTTQINAFKGSLASPTRFLAVANTIGTADAWDNGGAVQNSSVAAGDAVGAEVVDVGTATEITVQIDFTRL